MALSFVTYTGDGAVTSFNVPFPYINKIDISVFVNEVSTPFTWLSAYQVSISTAPENGSTVKIKRSTNSITREVDFVDGAVLTEADLDKSNEQPFYLSQESKDDSDIALKQGSTGDWDGENRVLKNLGTPVNPTDAATKTYIDTQTVNAFVSATNAATSETNATIAEVGAVEALDRFTDLYLGASETEPTTDLDGQPLIDGALFFNSSDNIMYVFDLGNTLWVRLRPTSSEQNSINEVSTNIDSVNITATNIEDINTFSSIYKIASEDPTENLTVGDIYYNTTISTMLVYNGSFWADVAPVSPSNLWDKVSSPNQTQIVANNTSDTLNFDGANGVAITTDASTNTLTVGLPTFEDTDGDTYVKVEANEDEDKVRIGLLNTDRIVIEDTGIIVNKSNGSLAYKLPMVGSTAAGNVLKVDAEGNAYWDVLGSELLEDHVFFGLDIV